MAIWDRTNGGTNVQIANLWDQTRAGSNSQIGYVWDRTNAGSNSLIYQRSLSLPNQTIELGQDTYSPWNVYDRMYVQSKTAWNLSNIVSLSFTLTSGAYVGYWQNSGGVVYGYESTVWLRLADNKDIYLNFGNRFTSNHTVNLSAYSNTQKASVRLRALFAWNINDVSYSKFYGNYTLSNAVGIYQV